MRHGTAPAKGFKGVGQATDESSEARFGRKIKVMPNGCWAYNGDLSRYAKFRTTGPRSESVQMPAHRFAWQTFRGPIPPARHLHHHCLNPGCVNPAHLEVMTVAQHQAWHEEHTGPAEWAG